jgi:iron complex transport system permease protein
MTRRPHPVLALLGYAAFAVVAVTVAPHLGSSEILGGGDAELVSLVESMRRSRALLAAVAGGGLALAGVLLQSLLRNPLATPFTLGVASGGSLGAVLVIHLGLPAAVGAAGAPLAVVAAMAGALAAMTVVWLVARSSRGGVATETLLLAGVAVSTTCGAVVLFLLYSADPTRTARILHWMIGAITEDPVLGWRRALAVGGFVVVALFLAIRRARDLNVLVFGDEVAASRGVAVGTVRLELFLVAGVLTAAVVASTGPIGFVGLVVPHACRLLTGPDHRVLVPASFLTGAGYLALCDAAARIVLDPVQLPVGIVTAFVGGPTFVWLLVRARHSR